MDNDDLETAKKEILAVLNEALKANVITEDEYKHMNPMNDKKAARTYMLFKVHKAHQEGSAPPERPVISGSGSITENPSKFCQHYMKQVSKDHASFLRDTCDFLLHIQNIENLPDNAILATIDVTGLYTHIPRDEGMQATREGLDRRANKTVPTDFIVKLLELLTKWNIFEFNGELYQQLEGTAMGQTHAPDYADIFMAVIDKLILEAAASHGEGVFPIRLMKRFLDDLFRVSGQATRVPS